MDNRLKNIVLKKISEKGKITFREFMDIALYEPNLGYYQKENPFGQQGSFYTSVNASESFGRSIAKGILKTISETNLPGNICEMGAGSGLLANDILNYYKNFEKNFYNDLTYTIIEKSEYLINFQKEILKEHLEKVRWIDFQNFSNFKGVFFSNELVDAFPVHRVIRINDTIKELYVIEYEEKLTFYPDTLSTPLLKEYLDKLKIKLVDKQIADINLDAVAWIGDLAKKIEKGVIITIDYGFMAEQLYVPFRMDGTVTCYFKHTQNNDFFERIGFQDITAFVDFSALKVYGQDAGLEFVNFMPQWTFLIASGILDDLSNDMTDLQKASLKSLIMPEGGFGTNFHVIIQSKGVEVTKDFFYKKNSATIFAELLSKVGDVTESN
jgi:SAM-dependent MidA family methyltransferase